MAEILSPGKPGVTERAARALLFATLFALPWIDRTNLSTLLLCALGIVAVVHTAGLRNWRSFRYSALFWLFGLYYLGYIIAWTVYPDDESVKYALQQKIAFVAVPLIFTTLPGFASGLWPVARSGFVSGTAFALMCCLVHAGLSYLQTPDSGVFFYHDLVKLLSANAIYTSLYVLISMIYLMDYLSNDKIRQGYITSSLIVLVVFLLGGLLLLSSKLIIVAGIMSILYYIYRHSKSKKHRVALISSVAIMLTLVFVTPNRINERFSIVAWQKPDVGLRYSDYSNANFDGLNLRVLLWRMGLELLQERSAWTIGLGGKHYHEALNEKIASYKLYEGYQGIDFHSHYMEVLVGFGLIGLLLWIVILGNVLYFLRKADHALPAILMLIFSISFLTESVLETQAGILVFTIIISGEWIQKQYS